MCSFRRTRSTSALRKPYRPTTSPIASFPTPSLRAQPGKNFLINDWEFSTILSFESPHYFTKFAGLDTNADGFTANDRTGIEPRNTFKGDSYQSVDLRVSRTFKLSERFALQALAESFNTLNTVNVRFYNTVYTAPDFYSGWHSRNISGRLAKPWLRHAARRI